MNIKEELLSKYKFPIKTLPLFCKGITRILDLRGSVDKDNRIINMEYSDYDAIKSDWDIACSYITEVIPNYNDICD